MYQFFVEPEQIHIEEKRVEIVGPDVNHIRNVLRMKPGEELSVSNGQDGREYRCGILYFADGEEDTGKTREVGSRVVCELRFIKEDKVELPARIHLFQALPKGDKMELIVQKAVELGVYRIVPVEAKRCVVKLDGKKAASKTARWQGIAQAAAKQSRRAIVPQVSRVLPFGEAVEEASGMDVKLIPYELADDMSRTRALLEEIGPGQEIAVFIGPEGGFEEGEILRAREAGIEPVTLGRRILRTETAGLAVLSWMVYLLEDRDRAGVSRI